MTVYNSLYVPSLEMERGKEVNIGIIIINQSTYISVIGARHILRLTLFRTHPLRVVPDSLSNPKVSKSTKFFNEMMFHLYGTVWEGTTETIYPLLYLLRTWVWHQPGRRRLRIRHGIPPMINHPTSSFTIVMDFTISSLRRRLNDKRTLVWSHNYYSKGQYLRKYEPFKDVWVCCDNVR